MRQRGNFRLLLNAKLWSQMPVSMMDGNKVRFARFAVLCNACKTLLEPLHIMLALQSCLLCIGAIVESL